MEGTKINVETQEKTKDEKKTEQSILDIQMSIASPQHVTNANIDIVKIKDVYDTLAQNINLLTKKDMKKILLDTTTKVQLCINLVLVSVDEIEKEKRHL